MSRKWSFRYMVIDDGGWAQVQTQDSRRRRNVLTGNVPMGKIKGRAEQLAWARAMRCSVIVREKTFTPKWERQP